MRLCLQARGEDVGDIKAMSDIVKGLQKFRYESERCSIAANVLQETMKHVPGRVRLLMWPPMFF